MKVFPYRIAQILVRFLFSISLFVLGFYFISIAEKGFASLPQILLGMACFVIGAFLIAPPIAKWIATPAGSIYFPKGESEMFPMYGVADSFVKRGLFLQAINEYKKISEKHPEELRPYVEMIKISIEHLKDFELAADIRDKGISVFKGKKEEKILSALIPKKVSSIAEEDNVLKAFDEALKKIRK